VSGTIIGTVAATDYASLLSDVQAANGETTPGTYTIEVSGTISLSGALPAIDLASGVSLDIVGLSNATLDGGNSEPGLFAYQGDVSIDDLIIRSATAQGGNGAASGGGGGAGLGGGLFVGSHATVTLNNVGFNGDAAIGGNGAAGGPVSADGAGGHGRTAGGVSYTGAGGAAGATQAGFGGGGGGGGPHTIGQGGFGGGNGAMGHSTVVSHPRSVSSVIHYTYPTGMGGHRTGTQIIHHPSPTFTVKAYFGAGGGGLGAGGDVFVQSGGRLTVLGGSLSGGTVQGGTGANAGQAFGSGIFIQGTQSVTLAPGAGQTLTIGDVIADQNGSGGTGSLVMSGAGDVQLNAANTFAGGIVINSGTVEIGASGSPGSGTITFDTTDATLRIDGTTAPTNTISAFISGDTIDLHGITYSASDILNYTTATGELDIIKSGSTIASLFFGPGNTIVNDPFHLNQESGGTGIAITNDTDTPCYLRGTLVETPDGAMPVEALAIGDHVLTLFGEARPIKWIGRRSYAGRFAANRAVQPIRICAGALDEGVPRRDLYVSPLHALFIDDVLVPAEKLVNGVSIVRCSRMEMVEYFHIELDTHDVLLAEGAPAESFADCDNRGMFHNGAEFAALYPGDERAAWAFCAPRIEDGDDLARIRWKLEQRFGWFDAETTADPGLHLLVDGERVDAATRHGEVVAFRLHRRPQSVRIVSRSAAPDWLGPTRDIRELGVALRRITLTRGRRLALIEATDARLADGFHPFEPDHGIRWTNGNAALPTELFDGFDGPIQIELTVAAAVQYVVIGEAA
jgi:autotransporter-associated beta strand protein